MWVKYHFIEGVLRDGSLKALSITRFINQSFIYDCVKVTNTRCLFLSYNTPIATSNICLLVNPARCDFRYLHSSYQLCKNLKGCSKCGLIGDLKIRTEILQGFPSLIKVCTNPLPEYDNWNFARDSPMDFSLPLGPTQISCSSNNQSLFSV